MDKRPTTLQEALVEVDQENREHQDNYKKLLDIAAGGLDVIGIGSPGPKPPGFKQKFIITLKRVLEGPADAAGSTIAACQGCHAACWISPKGRAALVALPDARVLCVECTVREFQREGAPS